MDTDIDIGICKTRYDPHSQTVKIECNFDKPPSQEQLDIIEAHLALGGKPVKRGVPQKINTNRGQKTQVNFTIKLATLH